MKSIKILLPVILAAITTVATAQQHMADTMKMEHMDHHMHHPAMKMTGMPADTMPQHHAVMSSQYSIDLPMNRDGSGTSWVPDSSPMYAYMKHGKRWMSMLHFNQFIRYNAQDVFKQGSRGGSHFDAPNMIMGMTQTQVGKNGLFGINAMLSFDPFLVGNHGYPLEFQTGETYKGSKLVDRQHPHDLVAQLALSYTQHLGDNMDAFVSAGYPFEPALGPPVFMHRLSGMSNPDAPLTHHYADATHITFGVATLGFRYKDFKIEGSTFTGREPDEHRYDFDKPKFDSYSVRLSYNPSNNWALQVSNGWIHSPEELEPDHNVIRTTASVMNVTPYTEDSYLATTLVYGQNHISNHGETLPSVLLESTLQLSKTAVYGRFEYVKKNADELDLLAMLPTNPDLNINALTLGTNRIIFNFKNTDVRAGIQGTLNVSPTQVRSLYGTAPMAVEVYMRISPSLMTMGGHKHPKMVM
ncbi:hypothetical protein C8P68_101100 [Mucilaginibacter yixingensis]|uniref:Uncharacterized protein n=1 Tax=Mucilaginibacter yixingensis TaxID=1295612 RepID=A0A2T5JEK6_9SPHI|nr:hypothetical protein [Mucilaginibacter yixingensis]PTR00871.1 hypothetical protein C8P68_101100 [Mucilaginibacter yixingensis]